MTHQMQKKILKRTLNIPFHEKLTFKQMNFVINSLNKLVNNF